MQSLMRVAISSFVVVVVFLGLASTASVFAGATTLSQNITIPVETFQYVDCAQEYVTLSGQYHTQWHVTMYANGTAHTESHANNIALKGTSTSGSKYTLVGSSHENWNFNFDGNLPYETTLTVKNLLIGQGSAPDLIFRSTYHVTVNANGVVTAQASNYQYECRQKTTGKPTPTPAPYPAP